MKQGFLKKKNLRKRVVEDSPKSAKSENSPSPNQELHISLYVRESKKWNRATLPPEKDEEGCHQEEEGSNKDRLTARKGGNEGEV